MRKRETWWRDRAGDWNKEEQREGVLRLLCQTGT